MANADLNIKLSPELLLQQSQEMLSLKTEYESLFQNTLSDLQGVNSSWSEFLSNNFTAKIQSAQKSFSGVETMLQNGAYAASLAANGLSSIDSSLSKFISSAQLGLSSGGNATNFGSERLNKVIDMWLCTDELGKKEAKLAVKATADLVVDVIGIPYNVGKIGTNLLKGNYLGAISDLKGMVDSTVNTAQDAAALASLGIGRTTSLFSGNDKYRQLFYEEAAELQKTEGLTGAMESADMPDWAVNISKGMDVVGDTAGVIGKGVGFVGDVSEASKVFSSDILTKETKVGYAKDLIFSQLGFSNTDYSNGTVLGSMQNETGFLGNIKNIHDWTNGFFEKDMEGVLTSKVDITDIYKDSKETVENIIGLVTGDPTLVTDGLDSTTSKIADSLLGVRETVVPWTVR